MALIDKKITDTEKNQYNVKSTLGNRLRGSVQENKNVFDKLIEFTIAKYNEMIDELIGQNAATQIGAVALKEGGANTVAGQLVEIYESKVDAETDKGLSDENYSKIEKDKLKGIEENANSYTLPTASNSVMGGIRLGQGLEIDAGGKVSAVAAVAPDLIARASIAEEIRHRQAVDDSLQVQIEENSRAIGAVNTNLTAALSTITVKNLVAGDVITATCGETVMTATCAVDKDSVTFLSIFRGAWTIEATGKLETVVITSVGDFSVFDGGYEQLVNYTMLYDEGAKAEDWEILGTTTIKQSNCIYQTSTVDGNRTSAITKDIIDFTQYSKLKLLYALQGHNTTTGNTCIGYVRTAKNNDTTTGIIKFAQAIQNTDKGIFEIDVSAINQKCYVSLVNSSKATTKWYNAFLLKRDDYEALCTKAAVIAPDTLSALIADTSRLTAIFASVGAVEFMIKCCTGDFMASVLNDTAAKAALKASPHINKVIANPHWAKFMMILAPELLGYMSLYDNGNENVDVTGGWGQTHRRNTNNATLTKNNDNMTLYTPRNSGQANSQNLSTLQKISFEGYSKATVVFNDVVSGIVQSSAGNQLALVAWETNNTDAIAGATIKTVQELTAQVFTSPITLDITAATDKKYLVLHHYSNAMTRTMTITNILLLKTDNWQAWLTAANIDYTKYADIDAVLADITAVSKLMMSEATVNYMLGCTGDLMFAILNSTTAVNAIKANTETVMRITGHPCYKHFIDELPVPIVAGLNLLGGA